MDVVICSDVAFWTVDGKSSFGYIAMLKGSIVDACAWIGPKVASSKEAEAGAVLATLKKSD